MLAHGDGGGYGVFHIIIIYKNLQMTSQISIGVVYLQEHQRDTSDMFNSVDSFSFSFPK